MLGGGDTSIYFLAECGVLHNPRSLYLGAYQIPN